MIKKISLKTTVIGVVFAVILFLFGVYFIYSATQTAWPNSGDNNIVVRMSGPWGDSGLKISAKCAKWGNKEKKTKNQFVSKTRQINLTASAYGNNAYKARLIDTAPWTTKSTDGNFAWITFKVAYTIPAHYRYNNFEVAKPNGAGGEYSLSASIPHSSTQREVTVTYTVNVSLFGMTLNSNNQRVMGTQSVIRLTRDNVTVRVYGNGGSVSTGSITKADGSTIGTLPSAWRTYYDFMGWTDQNGNGVSSNSIVCANGVTAIYANWEHQTATVTYNPRGGSGTMADQEIYLGQNTALRGNAYTREGYTFAGWATDPDSQKVSYTNGKQVTLTNQNGLDLYAVWTRNDGVFDTTQLIQDAEMFGADGELVGGEGTTFDRNRTDSRFAHIDGGKDDPAYFTKK